MQYHFIPASLLLTDYFPRDNVRIFRDHGSAEQFVQSLNLTDAQIEVIIRIHVSPTADGSVRSSAQMTALLIALLAKSEVVVEKTMIAAAPAKPLEFESANGPGNKPMTLGPHVGASAVNNKPVSPSPNPKLQAENDIKNGNVHKLDKDTKQVYDDYNSNPPKIGGTAKELAPKLAKMNEKEFTEFMDKEVKAGKCTMTPEHGVPSPLGGYQNIRSHQTMLKYEYPDGTMVRYKPEGDFIRVGQPTYSIEVKKFPLKVDPGGSNSVHTDVAFKVDERARLVPKHPQYLNNPYMEGTEEYKMYTNTMMDFGHKTLPM